MVPARRVSLAVRQGWLPAIVLLALTVLLPREATPAIRTVALTGDPAPGTTMGETFSRLNLTLNSYEIDGQGRLSFYGQVDGEGVGSHNDRGIWSETTGTLRLVARDGDRAPGTPSGVVFDRIAQERHHKLQVHPDGQIAFKSFLAGEGLTFYNDSGFWVGDADSLVLGARSGDRAPGTPPDTYFGHFSYLGRPLFNSAGDVAFSWGLVGPNLVANETRGMWLGPPGELRLIALEGDPAPGLPSDFVSVGTSKLTEDGDFVFNAYLGGTFQGSSIWRIREDSLELVARPGSAAPGLPGVEFRLITHRTFDAHGNVAFKTRLFGEGVDPTNFESIWAERSGALELVARTGDRAPGTPEGVVFGGSTPRSGIRGVLSDDEGGLMITSTLTGDGIDDTNNLGVWFDASGDLELVARTGDQAPGMPDGVKFDHVSGQINAAGQIAIKALIMEEGVQKRGVWAQDRQGVLQLVVLEGQEIEVAPGEFQQIEQLLIPSSSLVLGDRGHVAFGAHFEDNRQGLFVSSLLVVPEPSSVLLLLLAIAMVWRRRR